MNVEQLSTMTEAELHARANAHLEHLDRENESNMEKQHHATQAQVYLAEIDRRKQAQERSEHEQTAKEAEAERLIDAVTGILQRGELDTDLAKIANRDSDDSPVSFVMIDLDHFKTFNDTYGHPAGDAILRAVAQKVATVVRGKGGAYRYGGEEMSVILPNHTLGEAMAVAERIRNEIAGVRVASVGDCAVTASLGIATIPETSDAKTMTIDADRALYEAKHSGRNRVCCAAKEKSGAPVPPTKAMTRPKSELLRVTLQTQSQGNLPTTTVKVVRVFGSIENISTSRRIREYACTLSVPTCCLTFNSGGHMAEIASTKEGYRRFRYSEKNHAGVSIHAGDRFQVVSVDIAVNHLPESERQKCLGMEVIATAEADDDSVETRKTVAELMGA